MYENTITQNHEILGDKPTIAGTRMSVESVLELLASGMDIPEIMKEYPFLKKEHILAAVEYATKIVGKTETYNFKKNTKSPYITVHEIPRRH